MTSQDWTSYGSFSIPANVDNRCTDLQKNGYTFDDIPVGPIGSYDDNDFEGLDCEQSSGSRLTKRTVSSYHYILCIRRDAVLTDCAFHRANTLLANFQRRAEMADRESSPIKPSRSRPCVWLPITTLTCIWCLTCPTGLSVIRHPPAAREDPISKTTSAVEPSQSQSSNQTRTRISLIAMFASIKSTLIAAPRSSQ